MGIKHIGSQGIKVSHKRECLPFISEMVKSFQPHLMIELGTLSGGFTYVLHKALPDVELHTFDIKKGKVIKTKLYNENVYFHRKCDIISSESGELVELCRSEKKKILYCDNGKKEQEIRMYSKYLSVGDMLGMHDWNTEVFYDNLKDELSCFYPHEINKVMEKNGCLSRFWIKFKEGDIE